MDETQLACNSVPTGIRMRITIDMLVYCKQQDVIEEHKEAASRRIRQRIQA